MSETKFDELFDFRDLRDLEEQFKEPIPCEYSGHQRLTDGRDESAKWIVFLGPRKCCSMLPKSLYVCNMCFYRAYCRTRRLRCLYCKTECSTVEIVQYIQRIR